MNNDRILEYFFTIGDFAHATAYTYTGRYMQWKIMNFVLKSFVKEAKRFNNRPLRVLDIGCNNGDLIFHISNMYPGYYFTGVDINSCLIAYANKRADFRQDKRIKFFEGDCEHLNFDSKSFDIIIITDVLEHLLNPEMAVKEIYRLLDDTGLAIISVPNGNNLFEYSFMKSLKRVISSRLIFKPRYDKEKGDGYSRGHVSMFSRRKWIRLFEEQHLQVKGYQRGAMFYGGNWIDGRRILFAACLFLDVILDRLPIFNDFTENLLFNLRKM